MMSHLADKKSLSKFYHMVLFLWSNLVTDPSFMSISSLALELPQLSFIRHWPEIRKSETPLFQSCAISVEWVS